MAACFYDAIWRVCVCPANRLLQVCNCDLCVRGRVAGTPVCVLSRMVVGTLAVFMFLLHTRKHLYVVMLS